MKIKENYFHCIEKMLTYFGCVRFAWKKKRFKILILNIRCETFHSFSNKFKTFVFIVQITSMFTFFTTKKHEKKFNCSHLTFYWEKDVKKWLLRAPVTVKIYYLNFKVKIFKKMGIKILKVFSKMVNSRQHNIQFRREKMKN